MTVRNLDYLFRPKSVALIGASVKPHSVGATVMANLIGGGFNGPIFPVNPKYEVVANLRAYPDVAALPEVPDLAVVCTPPATVPGLIDELGRRGTKAAIVLTAGLSRETDRRGRRLKDAMVEEARPHLLRILGPNCVGLIVPGVALNASFAHTNALPGKLAFISQSGALTTAVLDWARSQGIGFSHFVSLGDSADVDFGDVIDYLASDVQTRAILLYIEWIQSARKFMSAARAAARNKPVLVVKAGRAPEGAKAAATHTGGLAGADAVYDAAIRRAGMLRVYSTEDLFAAVETLARVRPLLGDRLTIMTNGGGAGVVATDALALGGGRLAALAPETLRNLNELLPATWSHDNPVDIIGDAPIERYLACLKILQQDPQSDAILFIHAPTAIVSSSEIATALAPAIKQSSRNVFACWLGGDAVAAARRVFQQSEIPTYDTPEQAVNAFLQVVDYHRNQELLAQTPPSAALEFKPDTETARAVVRNALASGQRMLTEPEAKAVLAAYGLPVVETRTARTPDDAVRIAQEMGFPIAVKILSPDITHKSTVGGVALDLETPNEVRAAAQAMVRRLEAHRPGARLVGFSVQRMARRPNAAELIVGASTDPVFGPVILFGQGGIAVEAIGDRAIGLPPLNLNLARELVSRTRIARLLAGYRDRPPIDHDALYLALVQVSQLVCDLPEIAELDINPLFADDEGVLALDARMAVTPADAAQVPRLAIRPYPAGLEERVTWGGHSLLLRPIRPEDEPRHGDFFRALTPEDIYFRFFNMIREPDHSQLARWTQIDYDREMAFVAIARDAEGRERILGEARVVADPDNQTAEFAIVVRSDLKERGLGTILFSKLIRYCRDRGTAELVGEALPSNARVIALARDFGFATRTVLETGVVQLRLALRQQ